MMVRGKAALVLLAILAGAGGAGAQTSKSRGMNKVETSIWRQFEAIRGSSRIPYESADWPHFDLTAMDCSPPPGVTLDAWIRQITVECTPEVVGVATEWAQLLWPEIDLMAPPDEVTVSERTLEQMLRDILEAPSTTTGLVIQVPKCTAVALWVVLLRAQGAPESEVQAKRTQADSIADVAAMIAFLVSATKGLHELVTGLSSIPERLERWKLTARADHDGKLAGFKKDLLSARESMRGCSAVGGEKIIEKTIRDARQYVDLRRNDVVHFEKQIYCEAMGRRPADALPTPTDSVRAMPSFSALSEAHDMAQDAALLLKEAERDSERLQLLADSARKRAKDFQDWVKRSTDAVPQALATCDMEGLKKLRQQFDAMSRHECLGPTGLNTEVRDGFIATDVAFYDLEHVDAALNPLIKKVDELIASCRFEQASAAMHELNGKLLELQDFVEAKGINFLECTDLKSWLAGDPVAFIAAARRALSQTISDSENLLQSALLAYAQCNFDEASGLLEQANTHGKTECPIPFQQCTAASTDLVCSLVTVEEQRIQSLAEVSATEAKFRAEMAQLHQRARELEGRGQEQVRIANGDTVGRCDARKQVPFIAKQLRSLRSLECPGREKQESFAATADALEAQLAGTDAGLRARARTAQERGQTAAANCEVAEVEAAIAELNQLQPLLCGAGGADSSALEQELKRIDREAQEAKAIAAEAQARIDRWLQTCDETAIQSTEALILNESSCGYKQFTLAEKRVLQNYAEIAGAVTTQDLVGRKNRALAAIAGNLKRAEIQIGAAEKRSRQGALTPEERETARAEMSQAGVELGGAKSVFDQLHNEALIPPACYNAREQEWIRLRARHDGITLYTGVGDTGEEEPDEYIWDVAERAKEYTESADADDEEPEDEEVGESKVDALLAAAWEAYSLCDFDGADRLTQEALREDPMDRRTGRLRVLILRQRAAANLLAEARARRTLAAAQRAVAAARIKLPPPRCLVAGIEDLFRDLEGELAAAEEEERLRAAQEWEDMYDEIAAAAIGLLGEMNRRQNARRPPPTTGGSGGSGGRSTSRQGSGTCFVQEPTGDTGGVPYVMVQVVQGNVTVYVPRTFRAKQEELPEIIEGMKNLDPTIKRFEGPFSSYGAARSWAIQQCPQ